MVRPGSRKRVGPFHLGRLAPAERREAHEAAAACVCRYIFAAWNHSTRHCPTPVPVVVTALGRAGQGLCGCTGWRSCTCRGSGADCKGQGGTGEPWKKKRPRLLTQSEPDPKKPNENNCTNVLPVNQIASVFSAPRPISSRLLHQILVRVSAPNPSSPRFDP